MHRIVIKFDLVSSFVSGLVSLFSYSDIIIEREVLMQKYIHLVQIVETEKVAANQLRTQLEDQDTEIERLKAEVLHTFLHTITTKYTKRIHSSRSTSSLYSRNSHFLHSVIPSFVWALNWVHPGNNASVHKAGCTRQKPVNVCVFHITQETKAW